VVMKACASTCNGVLRKSLPERSEGVTGTAFDGLGSGVLSGPMKSSRRDVSPLSTGVHVAGAFRSGNTLTPAPRAIVWGHALALTRRRDPHRLRSAAEDGARAPWRDATDSLRERFARVPALLDDADDEALAHTALPNGHWCKFASTNPR